MENTVINSNFMVIAVPVLMYGSENWSLNRPDNRTLEAAKIRFSRSMPDIVLFGIKKK
jgi:hypothetical protein